MRAILVKACLNGLHDRDVHPALPVTPEDLAAQARAAVDAGAAAVHVHPRGPDGRDSLAPAAVAATVEAIRAACPGIRVGVTTGIWAAAGVEERLESVAGWEVAPDFASVNLSEPGAEDLAVQLRDAGIAVEAGLASMDDAERLLAAPIWRGSLRVLVEVQPDDPVAAVEQAASIEARLTQAGVALPQLHHGDGPATWAVLEAAVTRGHDIRIGLEDVRTLPDGRRAAGNEELVAAAVALVRSHGHEPAVA
jgi:uncharacterized protein (DUF849 family)